MKKNSLAAWFAVGTCMCFYCYQFLLRSFPNVASEDLRHFYQIGKANFAQLLACLYYIYTPMQLLVGMLIDRFPLRKFISFSFFICVFSAIIPILSSSFFVAKLSRLLLGLGSATAFVGTVKISTLVLTPSKRGLAAGLTMTLAMLGSMFGVRILAYLIEKLGWEFVTTYVFIFPGFFLAGLLFFSLRHLPQFSKHSNELQILSWLKFFKEIVMAIKEGKVWLSGLIATATYTSLSLFSESFSFDYLTQGHRISREKAGAATGMVFLGWAVGSPFLSWISDRIKIRVMPIRVGIIGAALCITLVLFKVNIPIYMLYTLLFFYGFFSSVELIAFTLGRESMPHRFGGTAISVINFFSMVSGMFCIPLIGTWLSWLEKKNVMPHIAYQKVFLVLPLLLLMALMVTFFLKETFATSYEERKR